MPESLPRQSSLFIEPEQSSTPTNAEHLHLRTRSIYISPLEFSDIHRRQAGRNKFLLLRHVAVFENDMTGLNNPSSDKISQAMTMTSLENVSKKILKAPGTKYAVEIV